MPKHRRKPKLVTQYLEKVNARVFADHPDIIREFAGKRNGIYALYRKGELYYAGLTKSLRSRLKRHLKDRHKQEWDSFSVYLTIGDAHLRELESLLIRVMTPPGNKQKGKFSGAENLQKKFARMIVQKQRAELDSLLGRPLQEADDPDKARRSTKVRGVFKGKKFYAWVRSRTGSVKFKGKAYSSLSAAAKAVTKTATNGRWFWKFERSPGEWIRVRKHLAP